MEKVNGAESLNKVVVIGPESTGKTTLSRSLAEHFNTSCVPEYAREYLEKLTRPYNEQDLVEIAKGQIELEERYALTADRVLICDTDLVVLKVWSEFKYGRCHNLILDNIALRECDLYLLTGTEMPWRFDPQREHPKLRDQLWKLYHQELNSLKASFAEINGNPTQRLQRAVALVADLV